MLEGQNESADKNNGIQRNDPPAASFGFRVSYGQRALHQIYLSPAQHADLILAERNIQRQGYDLF